MSHFAGESACTGKKQVIHHDTQADTSARFEHRETIQIARLAIHVFGQTQRMCVMHQCAVGLE
jgi:hypothetical protein